MSTALEIKTLRLEITDPYGIIDIQYVATTADLPADPLPQTAYLCAADGAYYKTSLTTGAAPSDYTRIPLRLSDTRVGTMIDTYGAARAVGKALRAIAKMIGAEIPIVRQTAGAESTEFQNILELYRYYKSLAADVEEDVAEDEGNNAGGYFRTRNPTIGGGDF